MKIKLALDAASLALFGSASTFAQEMQAVQIDIFGIGPAVDERAFRQVRTLIGREIIDNDVTQFIVSGFGAEGGFAACVELRTASEARDLAARLRRIRPNPETTSYNVRLVQSCQSLHSRG